MKKIFVTKPFLPSFEEYTELLKTVWNSSVLTNNGALHERLEQSLCSYLGVENLSLVSNGTLALQIAILALDLKGEIITTPYSFVATAHSIVLSGLKPVFVDIDPVACNLDPGKIEQAITDKTCAIMPVHVYGNPCDNDAIMAIAKKHNLKVIYDAAHAFGVKKDGVSVLNWGDISTLSFHATKVFNTFEGGAIVCNNPELKQRIDRLKNFGFVSETEISECGFNAKMNEAQAAMGLALLGKVDHAIEERRKHYLQYCECLKGINGLRFMTYDESILANYSYYPIFIESDYPVLRDELYNILKNNNIYSRRYFYPLITDFAPYQNYNIFCETENSASKKLAHSVLCLPMYPELSKDDINRICEIVRFPQNY